ncbi:MAG TPA: farnesyl diphosphate synthase [Candidatus Binataceae bacterium]|jgi:geranylgeranyl diphosphate synthase type II|nr:farnesyl diphosphate synthase [Candidatus Binataceae bacterium]
MASSTSRPLHKAEPDLEAPDGHAGAPTFNIESYLKERAQFVERALEGGVAQPDGPGGQLLEAMRYSLLAGGKRLRPILALAACEAVGGQLADAVGLACALEMIHTYSLIHDDLPCMDDDDLRRGRPTNHKVYGEAMATLAGDGLLTDAFKVLARSARDRLPATVVLDVVAELAEAAGSAGMVIGQAIDILSEGKATDLPGLEYLHARKTGALFLAAVRGGGLLGGGDGTQLDALTGYGRALGLAFQVIDDILDVEASAEQMGKRTHKDDAHGKATYPALMGVEQSRAFAHELKQRAIGALASFDDCAEPLRQIAAFVVERSL